MLGREPAMIITFIAAIIQAGWVLYVGDPAAVAEWALPVATVIAGLVIRQKVIPVETVKDAGLSPRMVAERAEDPQVPKHRGE